MDIHRVSCFVHREVEHHREIEERLTEIITDLLRTKEFDNIAKKEKIGI